MFSASSRKDSGILPAGLDHLGCCTIRSAKGKNPIKKAGVCLLSFGPSLLIFRCRGIVKK